MTLQAVTLPGKDYPMDFAYAFGEPVATARIKRKPQDFRVTEELDVEFSGEGEHQYLYIEKTGLNTRDVVHHIAQFAGVKTMDVGYAGMKDRHAVTRQWFSVYLPGKATLDWQGAETGAIKLLEAGRHRSKLRRGTHKSNRFVLRLTAFKGDWFELANRFDRIKTHGVPNYFGPQRFGFNGNNVWAAERMLTAKRSSKDRNKRGLYLSAARSYIFNCILSERVKSGTWDQALPGDMMRRSGLEGGGESPSGPLWGRGRLATGGEVQDQESRVAAQYESLCHGLEHVGLSQERRALVLPVADAEITSLPEKQVVEVAFRLPVSGYATSVLRELMNYKDVSVRNRD